MFKWGGTLTETVLWTNPDATARFVAQVVTISDDVSNYKYLKFVFKSSVGAADLKSVIYPVDEFKGYSLTSNQFSRASSPMRRNSSTADYVRGILCASETSISFGAAQGYNTASTNNDLTIPYQVIGIN